MSSFIEVDLTRAQNYCDSPDKTTKDTRRHLNVASDPFVHAKSALNIEYSYQSIFLPI